MLRMVRSMTLIELLIVLALMAGLAGMALTSVGEMGLRARYDETTSRMEAIRQAIDGDGRTPGRFVRDMGRRPVSLSELCALPADALAYGVVNAADHGGGFAWPDSSLAGLPSLASITLSCGWNGPYVLANDPGSAALYDGFGNDWIISTSNRTIGGETVAEITAIKSPGADNNENTTSELVSWEDEDRTSAFSDNLARTGNLVVMIYGQDLSGTEAVWRPITGMVGREGNDAHAFSVGDHIYVVNPIAGDAWAASTPVEVGAVIQEAGCLYRCENAGTTGVGSPSFPQHVGALASDNDVTWKCTYVMPETAVFRCTVAGDSGTFSTVRWSFSGVTTDGGVIWQYAGDRNCLRYCLDRLRAAVFHPQVNVTGKGLGCELIQQSGLAITAELTAASALSCGQAKVYAYGYFSGSASESLIRPGGVTAISVDLQPGDNHVVFYLK